MIHEKIWNRHYVSYDDVTDLIAECRRSPGLKILGSDMLGRKFGTWDQVYAEALAPWDKGIQLVEQMIQDLEGSDIPKPVCRKRRMRHDEADGDELEYDRLRAGQSYWRKSIRDLTYGPQRITIAVDVTAQRGHSPESVLWRGAAAIAMTHLLEDAGFRVELWVVNKSDSAYDDGSGYLMGVCLKQAGDRLDIANTVNGVSAWFYRTLMFKAAGACGRLKPTAGEPAWIWAEEDLPKLIPGGIGYPILVANTYWKSGAISLARRSLETLKTACAPPEPEPPEPEEEETEQAVPVPTPEPVKSKPLSRSQLNKIAARRRREERESRAAQKEWAKRNRQM